VLNHYQWYKIRQQIYLCAPFYAALKLLIKYILQKLLGFERYLRWFSAYKIKNLHKDKKENDFFRFMEMIPNQKGVILDIGANLGVMTIHLSRRFPQAQILAIEPIPINYKILLHNIKKHGCTNVTALQIAVGDAEGEATMVMPKNGAVKQHGLCHMEEVSEGQVEGVRHLVKVAKLDDLKGINMPVLAIKMDVENYESKTLQGALNLLERDKPVVYTELWLNENRDETIQLLEKLGYKTHCIVNQHLVEFDPAKHQTQNFVFLFER